jgi:hypothetical protein
MEIDSDHPELPPGRQPSSGSGPASESEPEGRPQRTKKPEAKNKVTNTSEETRKSTRIAQKDKDGSGETKYPLASNSKRKKTKKTKRGKTVKSAPAVEEPSLTFEQLLDPKKLSIMLQEVREETNGLIVAPGKEAHPHLFSFRKNTVCLPHLIVIFFTHQVNRMPG